MDYLVDTVVGTIPAYDELSDTAKATVGIVGVPATREKPAGVAEQNTSDGGGQVT